MSLIPIEDLVLVDFAEVDDDDIDNVPRIEDVSDEVMDMDTGGVFADLDKLLEAYNGPGQQLSGEAIPRAIRMEREEVIHKSATCEEAIYRVVGRMSAEAIEFAVRQEARCVIERQFADANCREKSQLRRIVAIIRNILFLGDELAKAAGEQFFDDIIKRVEFPGGEQIASDWVEAETGRIRARLMILGEEASRGEITSMSIYELFDSCSDGTKGKARGPGGFAVFTKYIMGENYSGRVTKRLIRGKIAKLDRKPEKYGLVISKTSRCKSFGLLREQIEN